MATVSIIIPCLNEEATIDQLLEAIHCQTYPLNDLEVVIADGFSTDHTRERISEFHTRHPELEVRVVDNQRRVIPSGLNRAIEASRGDFILRIDAHSIPNPDYIERCIRDLQAGLGDNVGGLWKIQPGAPTWMAKAIAIAAGHPFGAGDARYRIGGSAQEVETVPFGAYRREMLNKLGLFDENLLSNEDYELNVRLKQAGGRIWMDPHVQSIYFARANLRDLSRQYWRYGYWKAQMLRKHPRTLRWRQIIPPLFILALLGSAVFSLGFTLARWLLGIIVILYIIVLAIIGIQIGQKHSSLALAVGVPLATATIHVSWGSAFLWGLIVKPKSREK